MIEQQIQVCIERCGEVFYDKEFPTRRWAQWGDVELLGQFGSGIPARGCGSTTEEAAAEVVGFGSGWYGERLAYHKDRMVVE